MLEAIRSSFTHRSKTDRYLCLKWYLTRGGDLFFVEVKKALFVRGDTIIFYTRELNRPILTFKVDSVSGRESYFSLTLLRFGLLEATRSSFTHES